MRRKVIQIAGSTKIVSLPNKWCKEFNVNKGDEINVNIEGDNIHVSPVRGSNVERAEIDVSDMEEMAVRVVHAMYKRGVDELKVNFKNPSQIKDIQSAIGKEAMSFEIVEQGRNHVVIKSVAENLEEFGPILRRTFLLLINMAEDIELALSKKDFLRLNEIVFLEETNNRYTTFCRRLLNKKGSTEYKKIGPIYYIIEELENIADYYKFICKRYVTFKKDEGMELDEEAFEIFKGVNEYLKDFYKLFYKYDNKSINEMYKKRKYLLKRCLDCVEKSFTQKTKKGLQSCPVLLYNSWTILQHTFCMVGPYLTLKSGMDFKSFESKKD